MIQTDLLVSDLDGFATWFEMIEEDRGSGQCFGQLLQPALEGSFSEGSLLLNWRWTTGRFFSFVTGFWEVSAGYSPAISGMSDVFIAQFLRDSELCRFSQYHPEIPINLIGDHWCIPYANHASRCKVPLEDTRATAEAGINGIYHQHDFGI